MKLEIEISERAYKKLRSEVFSACLVHGDGMDVKTKALAMMFEAWENNDTPNIRAKGDEKGTEED